MVYKATLKQINEALKETFNELKELLKAMEKEVGI